MSPCRWAALAVLCCFVPQPVRAGAGNPGPGAKKLYTLDLKVRKAAEKRFSDSTRTLTVEVFVEPKSGRLLYVGDGGKALAVVAGEKAPNREAAAPKWLHRLTLPVRGWDEKKFTARTPTVGVEVYRDESTGLLVYVSELGGLAVVRPPRELARGQAPKALYRLPLKVRRAGENDFSRPALRCNVEVHRDESTGCLVYVAGHGAIAALPRAKARGGKGARPPVWSHGQDLKVRRLDEETFSAKTPVVGVEAYRDENARALLYITDALRFAVSGEHRVVPPGPPKAAWWVGWVGPPGGPVWPWSAEAFEDLNTGQVIYVTPSGSVAVVPTK
jgi:hypothetical protein